MALSTAIKPLRGIALRMRHRNVLQILSKSVNALENLSSDAVRSLAPLISEAKRELARDLAKLLSSGKGTDSFTAQRYRAALIQLELVSNKRNPQWLNQLKEKFTEKLSKGGLAAGRMGIEQLIREYAAFSIAFDGVAETVALDVVQLLGKKRLLERFQTSAARYTGQVRDDIKRQLRIGVLRGETFFEMTQRLRKLGGPRGIVTLRGIAGEPGAYSEMISEGLFRRYGHWASRVVRTEMVSVYNDRHAVALKEVAEDDDELKQQWDAAADARICPICRGLDGQVTDVGGTFPGGYSLPPAHPNCLLPGTRVGARVTGGLMARYDGPAVEIETMRGFRLRVTPNHPVATAKGFVPAGTIRNGDQVLADRGNVGVWRSGVGEIQEDQAPPRIEDVFGALSMVYPRGTATAADDDLHGDARFCHGDVRVVRADRELLNYIFARALEQICQAVFPLASMKQAIHSRSGALNLFTQRMLATSHGGPGAAALAFDAFAVLLEFEPLQQLGIGLPAQGNARRLEPTTENAATDSRLVGDLLQRFPSDIALDQVVNVRNFDFDGQVYDLQTETGWMVAQGIYISNCRCTLVPYKDRWARERVGGFNG